MLFSRTCWRLTSWKNSKPARKARRIKSVGFRRQNAGCPNRIKMAFKVKRPGMAKPSAERLVSGNMMSGRRDRDKGAPRDPVQVFVGAAHRKNDSATIELNWENFPTVTEIPKRRAPRIPEFYGSSFPYHGGFSPSVIHMIDQNRRKPVHQAFLESWNLSSFQQDFKIRTEAFTPSST
ncbi:MAG: hypothetical protein Ct9H90mP9_1210 [Pseudomonadota bacterium]|nr:MAG: hypothetical protein Ct9H90mP9_1210 [Pseudomonadota bacterium]